MAIDAVAGRTYMEAAIPGLTDTASNSAGTTLSDPTGTKSFPNLTPAQSAANLKAAGGTSSSGTSTGNAITGAAGGALGKTEFLQLLVQEMTNQDPLKPADNTQFIAQLAQFSTLEQMQNMNTGFTNLQSSFQAAQARGLLGVQITAVNSSTGANVNGVVDQIIVGPSTTANDGSVTPGPIQVDVNGTTVNLSDITSVGTGKPPAPALGSISPATGPLAGGTTVTITGANFMPNSTVSFGTIPGTVVAVTSPTSMTVTSPAVTAAGLVDVTVTTSGGTTTASTADQFTYADSGTGGGAPVAPNAALSPNNRTLPGTLIPPSTGSGQ